MEQLTRTHSGPPHRLTRRSEGKLIAGVASGIGERFQIEPNIVRLAFVVLALAGGAGVVLYLAGWLWLPEDDGTEARLGSSRGRGRQDRVQIAALGAIVLGVLLLAKSIGFGVPDVVVWPVVLAAVGTALIVGRSGRPIDELISDLIRRNRPATAEPPTRDASAIARVVVGAALVVSGMAAFLATQGAFEAFGQGLVAVVVVIGGLALIFGPWLWRLSHALVEERSERIRSDERAEMAAHLHDSVLQTLAMIQRQADNPRAVVGLARRQERELRGWLFGRTRVHADLDLGDAVDGAAADVEQREGVPIEVVRVGAECPLDDHMRALVFAAREAMVNAARHSAAAEIAVYVEVEDTQVTVFVRDRGRGFDLASVPSDRGGIAESIIGRMQRHGGVALIRSNPDEGTEVELSLRRNAP